MNNAGFQEIKLGGEYDNNINPQSYQERNVNVRVNPAVAPNASFNNNFQRRGVNIFEGVEIIKNMAERHAGEGKGTMMVAFAISMVAQAIFQGCGTISKALRDTAYEEPQ